MKEILISSSVLILLILLVRALFREKIPRRMMYSLWLLVVIRLLVPIQIGAFDFSVLTVSQKAEQSAPVQAIVQRIDTPAEPLPAVTIPAPTQAQPAPTAPAVTKPVETIPAPTSPQSQVQTPVDPTPETEKWEPIALSSVLKGLWILGMAALAIWFAAVNFTFTKNLQKGSQSLSCPECPIPVRISETATSPCLVGIFRPVIYLPAQFSEDTQRRSHVLAHELTHAKQHDNLWAFVRCLCLCIYWFDPFVWIAAILSKQDCELACDEGALQRFREDQRLSYGKTLVDTVAQETNPKDLFLSNTAMFSTKKSLKERVNAVVNQKRFTLSAILAVVVIAALAVVITYTGAKKDAPKQESPTPSEPASTTAPTTAPTLPPETEPAPTEPQEVYSFTYTPAVAVETQQTTSLVLDAAGNDVTEEIIELWKKYQAAINIYDNYDGTIFQETGENSIVDPDKTHPGKYKEIENYEYIVRSIFTEETLPQYEGTMFDFKMYRDPETGDVYEHDGYSTGGHYNHVDTHVISAEGDTLHLLTGSYYSELRSPMYHYGLNSWSATRENGIWKISEYPLDATSASFPNAFWQVTDQDGNDITQELADLWVVCNLAYRPAAIFESPINNTVQADRDSFLYLSNYDEVMANIFTERGKQQYEAAVFSDGKDLVRPFLRYEGKALHLQRYGTLTQLHPVEEWEFAGSYHTSRENYTMNGDTALMGMEILEELGITEDAENTMTLLVTYREFSREGDTYTPYTVLWTLKKQDGRWLVEDYTHPGSVDAAPTKTWDGLQLDLSDYEIPHTLENIHVQSDTRLVLGNSYYLYGAREEGNKLELLDVQFGDYVFFKHIYNDKSFSISRIHLPTLTVQPLVGPLPKNSNAYPISESEVLWYDDSPFENFLEENWNNTLTLFGEETTIKDFCGANAASYKDTNYKGEKRRALENAIEPEYFYRQGIPAYYVHHFDMATQTELTIGSWKNEIHSRYEMYPDGTMRPEEMQEENGKQWWLDEYYQ